MKQQEDYSAYLKKKFPPKEGFVQRMQELLGVKESEIFFNICYTQTPNSIRCNTLKITPDELKKRFENYGWTVLVPYLEFPEIMTLENTKPGEIGNSREHLLGFFYVQEISSMLPILVLKPNKEDILLDLCASPGSKTTQAAAIMENSGTIIANEISMGRLGILCANLERCGVSNTIVTRREGVSFCNTILKKSKMRFDKVLVDAPCSGEGTLRKSPKTFTMWNLNMIKKIARTQRDLAFEAMKVLKIGGEMVYSTCTLAPEENEEIIDLIIKNFDVEIQEINLPLKFRPGITKWNEKKYSPEVKKCLRLYPQDNDTDGFFVCKIKKLSDEFRGGVR